jgi:hypothetical protein
MEDGGMEERVLEVVEKRARDPASRLLYSMPSTSKDSYCTQGKPSVVAASFNCTVVVVAASAGTNTSV